MSEIGMAALVVACGFGFYGVIVFLVAITGPHHPLEQDELRRKRTLPEPDNQQGEGK